MVFLVRSLEFNSSPSPHKLLQIASALCGAAQNMVWLVVCRAIQGIGGGGIIQVSDRSTTGPRSLIYAFQMVQITISDIVSLEE
jgi:MFS family permease